MYNQQRCLLISEWKTGDGSSEDIMLRYDMALTFCTNADKLALKNAIQENFTKLKD